MVTAISLAHRRGYGLSLGSPSDFISHSTGQLCVRNTLTLRERGSLSQSQGSLHLEPGGTIDFYSFRYLDCIHLRLINPYRRIEAYFRFLSLPSRLPRNRDFKPDILSLVRSQSRWGFSMFESPCQIKQQTEI